MLRNHEYILTSITFHKEDDLIFRYPKLLLQLAVNSPDGSYMEEISSEIPSEDVLSIMKWLNKPESISSTCSLSISNIKSVSTVNTFSFIDPIFI